MRFLAALWLCLIVLAGMPEGASAEKNFGGKTPQKEITVPGGGNAARAWLSYYKGTQTDVDYDTISKFIENHPDFPAMNRLREEAEKAMPSGLSDKDAIAWFTANPPQMTFGMKMYANAISGLQNDPVKAREEINAWWKKANLTPVDQSKGFMTFATLLDKKSHEERLRRLITKGQYTNARSMAESLGSGYVALTEARISLQTGKGNVNGYLNRVPQNLQKDEGLLFDRLRYRRKMDNNEGAIEILNMSPGSDDMVDPEEWGKERSIMARRLFEERKYQQAYRLSANHKIKNGPGFAGNEWMAGWLAMEYLKNPWEGFEHFERLYHTVETPISKSRAAYWAGLASERLGHSEIAAKWYSAGAKYPTTFYGQLSYEKLGQKDRIVSNNVAASNFKNGALAGAAKWLKTNGYKAEAGLFINKMIEEAKTPADFAAVAEVANSIGMKNLAIKAAQESEKKTGTALVGYSFPKVEKYMGNTDVEWALVHALIRQESRYDEGAVSSAGARGLMQLMPGTAKEMAKKAGVSHQTDWLTQKPAHNVALGTRYLQTVLNRYDGNYAMALAAYNAGPGRVNKWIQEFGDPRDPKVDLVNWIEMIPIYETRNYVQRVLEGLYVYRQTLAQNKSQADGGVHLAQN